MNKFEKIAKRHLLVETLHGRKSDNLDFHECSVWRIAQALNAADELGAASG